MHNQYIRDKLGNHDGYEAEYTRNGFLLSFRDVKGAVNFCMLAQMELMHLQWSSTLLNHPRYVIFFFFIFLFVQKKIKLAREREREKKKKPDILSHNIETPYRFF